MDAQASFTPGPWISEVEEKGATVAILGPRGDGNVRKTDGRGALCVVHCATIETEDRAMWPDFNPEQVANARLIAAAPDLYEACKSLLEELRLIRMKDCGAVYDPTCRVLAQVAIEKAEGRHLSALSKAHATPDASSEKEG